MNRWSLAVLASCLAVAGAQMLGGPNPLRVAVSLLFALILPGLAVLRLLRIERPEQVWTLTVPTSLAIETVLALALVYTHHWSVHLILITLIAVCIAAIGFEERERLRSLWRARNASRMLKPLGETPFFATAGAVISSTVLSSGLGFAFWWFSARQANAGAVGLASALASATLLLGNLGTLGYGTLLMGDLARQRARSRFALAGAITGAGAGTLLGAAFVAVAPLVSREFAPLWSQPLLGLALPLGSGAISASVVIDEALIGLMRGGQQLARNVVAALARVALVVLVLTLGARGDANHSIYLAWIGGVTVSLAFVFALYAPTLRVRPNFAVMWNLRRAALGHHFVNVAMLGTGNILPVVVTALLSTATNATFYVAWMIVSTGWIIPQALSNVTYAIARRAPDRFGPQLRLSLSASLALSALYILIVVVAAEPILSVFGTKFTQDTGALQILMLGLLPGILKTHAIAIARVEQRVAQGARFAALGSVLELLAAATGARLGGLEGLCLGLTGVLMLEGLLCLPVIIRVAEKRAPSVPVVNRSTAMERSEEVCAVILTYNRIDLLRQCLRAVLHQSRPPTRIFVVDNASQDGTHQILAKEFPQVKVVRLEVNLGSAGGFTAGLERAVQSGAEWVWMLDDDCFPEREALGALLENIERFPHKPRPSVLASLVLDADGRPHPVSQPVCGVRRPPWRARGSRTSIRATTFVSTLINLRDVERLGLPMTEYFINRDDTEFTGRLLRRGFGLMVPESRVVHLASTKHLWEADPRDRAFFEIRNELWMILYSDAWELYERGFWLARLSLMMFRYLVTFGFSARSRRVVQSALKEALARRPSAFLKPSRSQAISGLRST